MFSIRHYDQQIPFRFEASEIDRNLHITVKRKFAAKFRYVLTLLYTLYYSRITSINT